MPRFKDDWLTDRVLFDFVAGGSCACCGFQHFLPNGTADLISAVSDLETDQAKAEIRALEDSPWPPELRDTVWTERVRLRQKLKMGMTAYQAFWDTHGAGFEEWSQGQSTSFWKRTFQLPRSEIMELIKQKYNIHSAFSVVLCGEVEQVAHFELTQYPPDGRGTTELEFEKALTFGRRGGFTLLVVGEGDAIQRDILQVWMERMKSLGGPKLLERGTKKTTSSEEGDDEEDEGGVDAAEPTESRSSAGFASDRRIIRLLITRYWADILQKRYLDEQSEEAS
jgi:hypothetical protein